VDRDVIMKQNIDLLRSTKSVRYIVYYLHIVLDTLSSHSEIEIQFTLLSRLRTSNQVSC